MKKSEIGKTEAEIAKEKSDLVLCHVLGHSAYHKNLLPEDWLEIIKKMIENIKPVLSETICDKKVDEILFNRSWEYDDSKWQVKTENWKNVLEKSALYLLFIGVKFGIIGNASIKNLKGDVASRALLAVNENGEIFLFFVRLTTKEKKIHPWIKTEVRECKVFSEKRNSKEFREIFLSLTRNNSSLCRDIIRFGLSKAYYHVDKKEKELKMLLEFRKMWEMIDFSR